MKDFLYTEPYWDWICSECFAVARDNAHTKHM